MNTEQIRDYVSRYLESTGSQVLESHPAYVTVKLSPEADKALMNRPYYWSFVERTGAEPETMSLTFVFDQEQYDRLQEQSMSRQGQPSQSTPAAGNQTGSPNATAAGQQSILARYFGISPATVHNRARQELITFGSGRLNQIFASAKLKGRYVHLYEQPDSQTILPGQSIRYQSYLGVNYKIEYTCDLKRDELHSLAICLSTGEIISGFHEAVEHRPLSPKLPAHTHIGDMLSLPRAVAELEHYVERYVKSQDHSWADQAEERMADELHRIEHYYQEMIQNSNDEQEKSTIEQEYRARQEEIAWQYKPRIVVSATGCGIFHLLSPPSPRRKLANRPQV